MTRSTKRLVNSAYECALSENIIIDGDVGWTDHTQLNLGQVCDVGGSVAFWVVPENDEL